MNREKKILKKEIKGTYTFEKTLIGKDKIPAMVSFHKQEKPLPAVICLHGWTGSKEDMLQHCLRMADAGFIAVAIDARMHGERIDPAFWGKFADNFPLTFVSVVVETAQDIVQVVDFLEKRSDVNSSRLGLMGISMGGFTSLVAATLEKRLKAVASVLGAADFPLFVERMASLQVSPLAQQKMRHPNEETKKLFEIYDPINNLKKFPPTTLLLIGGSQDPYVPKEGITRLYEALEPYYAFDPEKIKIKLHNVGHEYTDEMEAELIQWFIKHL
jgi:dienelactone hydrolase